MILYTENDFRRELTKAIHENDLDAVHSIRRATEDWMELAEEKATRMALIDAVESAIL